MGGQIPFDGQECFFKFSSMNYKICDLFYQKGAAWESFSQWHTENSEWNIDSPTENNIFSLL